MIKHRAKRFAILFALFLIFTPQLTKAGFFDELLKSFGGSSQKGLDEKTIISGLKEALSISAKNAVNATSKTNGYLDNQYIKIPLPSQIQKSAELFKKVGLGHIVDDFEISMNRAAEEAAPKAANILIEAIKGLSFDDARRILDSGERAATDYFEGKSFDKLYTQFRPIISKSMNDTGVTKYYKQVVDKYASIVPFADKESLDLDHYVTQKGLEGLFYMIAQEEKKIRLDPAGRITDLLKRVFGNQ